MPFTIPSLAILFFEILFRDLLNPTDAKENIADVILLGVVMVFVWSQLTNGDPNYTLVQALTKKNVEAVKRFAHITKQYSVIGLLAIVALLFVFHKKGKLLSQPPSSASQVLHIVLTLL